MAMYIVTIRLHRELKLERRIRNRSEIQTNLKKKMKPQIKRN